MTTTVADSTTTTTVSTPTTSLTTTRPDVAIPDICTETHTFLYGSFVSLF